MIMYVCAFLCLRNSRVIPLMVLSFSKPRPLKIKFSLLFWLRHECEFAVPFC
jgi:hypothetical protein